MTESVARTLWPGERAIGKIVRLPEIDNVSDREVVGVVGDLQFSTVGGAPGLHVFVPWSQMPTAFPRLVVRAAGSPESVLPAVRAAIRAERPATGIDRVVSLEDLVDRATAQTRFSALTVTGVGLLALALAAIGTYGTTAYLVGARRHEIGVRMALGAEPGTVLRQIPVECLVPVTAGGAAGLAMAAGASRAARALFFQVGALDPRAYGLAIAALAVAAGVAALLPALRAARIDPTEAPRDE